MATITGQEAIIRNGKIIGSPVTSSSTNKVLATDGNGAIVGSNVSKQKFEALSQMFEVINGELYVVWDDGL